MLGSGFSTVVESTPGDQEVMGSSFSIFQYLSLVRLMKDSRGGATLLIGNKKLIVSRATMGTKPNVPKTKGMPSLSV